jgi:hypothetical protein
MMLCLLIIYNEILKGILKWFLIKNSLRNANIDVDDQLWKNRKVVDMFF